MTSTKTAESRSAISGRDSFDPYIEGYDACLVAVPRTANPYRGPDAHTLWDDGWMEGECEARLTEPRQRKQAG